MTAPRDPTASGPNPSGCPNCGDDGCQYHHGRRDDPDRSYQAAMCDARAHLRRAQKAEDERDEARDWVRRMTAETRVLTCAFCGEAYPPGTPETNHERLTAHVAVCEKHPIKGVTEALNRSLEDTAVLRGRLDDSAAECARLTAQLAAATARAGETETRLGMVHEYHTEADGEEASVKNVGNGLWIVERYPDGGYAPIQYLRDGRWDENQSTPFDSADAAFAALRAGGGR